MKKNNFTAYVLNNSKDLAMDKGRLYDAQVCLTDSNMVCSTLSVDIIDRSYLPAFATLEQQQRYLHRRVVARTASFVATTKDDTLRITSRNLPEQHDLVRLSKLRDDLHLELDLLFAQIIANQVTEPTNILAA